MNFYFRKRDERMAESKRMLLMKDGAEYEITGENARYWFCKGTQFRKSNERISEVNETKRMILLEKPEAPKEMECESLAVEEKGVEDYADD